MRRTRTLAIALAVLLCGALGSASQEPAAAKKPAAQKAPAKHLMVAPDQLKWGPGPPALPPGAEAAVLEGDPGKAGMFTLRVKFPDGYMVPPHMHPTDERLTIISGTLMAGIGAKMDEGSMETLATGAYANMPARTNHYVRAKGETIVQVMAMGPFAVTYANPSDDPRKKTSTK